MRKTTILGLVFAFIAAIFAATPAMATNIGNQGCTLGYWKNHTDNWFEGPNQTLPIDPNILLTAPYRSHSTDFVVSPELANDSFLTALSYPGGPGFVGAEQNLMRQAVAAWLNAANEGLGYPYRRWSGPSPDGNGIVADVNAAIASGNRSTMLSLATTLDQSNNLGCPLN